MPLSHLTLTVSNLPQSTSFFLSCLPPLGYRYIGASGPNNSSIGFGVDANAPADFWLTQEVPGVPAGAAHLAFPAPNRTAVHAFFTAALKAGGQIHDSPRQRDLDGYYSAAVIDFDGNSIEAVHGRNKPVAIKSEGDMQRSLVLRDEGGRGSEVSRHYDDERIEDMVSDARFEGNRARDFADSVSPSRRQNNEGHNGESNAILGTLLGVAAGAAITYAVTKASDSNSKSREKSRPRNSERRYTEPMRSGGHRAIEGSPRNAYASSRTSKSSRSYYKEPKTVVEEVEYVAASSLPRSRTYAGHEGSTMSKSSHRSGAGKMKAIEAPPLPPSERGSRRPTTLISTFVPKPDSTRRPETSRASKKDSGRSTTGNQRPSSHHHRSLSHDEKSNHYSTHTIRENIIQFPPPPPPPALSSHSRSPSRSPSKLTTTSARNIPLPPSRTTSNYAPSAREVPLPPSRAASYALTTRNLEDLGSSRRASRVRDIDEDTIRPGDSVSQVSSVRTVRPTTYSRMSGRSGRR